jgi:hypothetical protein
LRPPVSQYATMKELNHIHQQYKPKPRLPAGGTPLPKRCLRTTKPLEQFGAVKADNITDVTQSDGGRQLDSRRLLTRCKPGLV